MIDKIDQASNLKEIRIAKGKKKAVALIISLIIVSIFSIVFAAVYRDNLSIGFVVSRLIRLAIELGLFYAMFNGKLWAKSFLTLSFTWGILVSIFSIFRLFGDSYFWILILIVAIVYAIAAYIINSDDDFDAFFVSQRFNPFNKTSL